MPALRSLSQSADNAFHSVSADAEVTITRQDILDHVAANPGITNAQIEQWVIDTVFGIDPGFAVYFHLVSRSPLSVAILTIDPAVTPAPNWWTF